MTADDIITHLGLKPHPKEGGFFREIYRSSEGVAHKSLPDRYGGTDRSHATGIYYLLTPDTFSHLHSVNSDEAFHFYLGDPVEMVKLHPNGKGERVVLGRNLMAGQHVTMTVPHGVWQGCRLVPGGLFALMGCTVAPGFEFRDYLHGQRSTLLDKFPAFEDDIIALTEE